VLHQLIPDPFHVIEQALQALDGDIDLDDDLIEAVEGKAVLELFTELLNGFALQLIGGHFVLDGWLLGLVHRSDGKTLVPDSLVSALAMVTTGSRIWLSSVA
jgi:hypothetical protein